MPPGSWCRCAALLIAAAPAIAYADFEAVPPNQATSAIAGARFEILQSQLTVKHTFKLDRFDGLVWELVQTSSGDLDWQRMPIIHKTAITKSGRPRFQLVTSGITVKSTFLIDTDTGDTWVLVASQLPNSDETIRSWAPFPLR